MVGREGEEAQEQIVSGALSRIAERKGVKFRLKQMEGGGMSGEGKEVTVGAAPVCETILPIEVFQEVKKALNESKKKMEELCQILRKAKVKMTPNVKAKLKEIDNLLEDEYTTVRLKMTKTVTVEVDEDEEKKAKRKKKKTERKTVEVERDLTILKDPVMFIKRMMKERGMKEQEVMKRVSIDGGDNSMKVILNIFDKHQEEKMDNEKKKRKEDIKKKKEEKIKRKEDKEMQKKEDEVKTKEEEKEEKKSEDPDFCLPMKKKTVKEGDVKKNEEKDEQNEKNEKREKKGELCSGVNRSIILCYAEDLEENYRNVRTILELLRFDELESVVAADYKLLNVLLGLSGHGGKFACSFCDAPKGLEAGTMRTFSGIMRLAKAYKAAGSNPKQMMKFKNVVNEPLIQVESDQPVWHAVPIPELHSLMGCTNHPLELLRSYLEGLGLEEKLWEWCDGQGITRRGYNGKNKLDGNNASRFLSKVDKLKGETWFPGEAEPILELLMEFRKVKDSCFSWKLKDGWRESINSYTEMYADLQSYSSIFLEEELTVTWKVHSVCCHLEQFLDKVTTWCHLVVNAFIVPVWSRLLRRAGWREHPRQDETSAAEAQEEAWAQGARQEAAEGCCRVLEQQHVVA